MPTRKSFEKSNLVAKRGETARGMCGACESGPRRWRCPWQDVEVQAAWPRFENSRGDDKLELEIRISGHGPIQWQVSVVDFQRQQGERSS